MSRVAQYAFLHGKMHGLHAKSFFNERLARLLDIKNLQDFSKEILPRESFAVPDRQFLHEIQRRFEEKNLKTLLKILNNLEKPPAVLVHVLKEYEYRNLKSYIKRETSAKREIAYWDLGGFGAFPPKKGNIDETLTTDSLKDLGKKIKGLTAFEAERILDESYFREFRKIVKELPQSERNSLEPLIKVELILRNLLWALRLRWYYDLPEEEILKLLFTAGYSDIEKIIKKFCGFTLDGSDPGQGWRFGWILAGTKEGKIDPNDAENRVNKFLLKKYRSAFHNNPFSLVAIYAFFRLKVLEAGFIRTISEGLSLNIPSVKLAEHLGVS